MDKTLNQSHHKKRNMEPKDYIANQSIERRGILATIHRIIVENDKTIKAVVEPMMGIEMILYKDRGFMKYGLAAVKKYMSLHLLPIYGSKTLHEKYKALLDKANFQKGCINFISGDEMPVSIVKKLITDCSAIDLVKIREDYLKSKKSKHKK
jgi:hypothetical protein